MKSKITIEDNKLIIENFNINEDGTVDVDISEEEWKDVLKAHIPRKTGYERVLNPNEDQLIYYDDSGDVHCTGCHDEDEYNSANYYSDKTVAENNARADKLMRQLRRFAAEHRDEPINYSTDAWYEIYYDCSYKQLRIEDVTDCRYFGTISFNTSKIAQLARDTFHDELVWYFTEYKDSL